MQRLNTDNEKLTKLVELYEVRHIQQQENITRLQTDCQKLADYSTDLQQKQKSMDALLKENV